MIRYILAATILLVPLAAPAQHASHTHSPAMTLGAAGGVGETAPAVRPVEPGQAAFAAIQEIVALLDADPKTDWSKVDMEALRRHLVDMDNVTLHADAAAAPVANGMRFTVTGRGPVRDSIRRMVKAHAATMNGRDGWTYTAADDPGGAVLTVVPSRRADLDKVKGLGFIGIMAYGMHYQEHPLMIATGRAPHDR